jgi:hypothetical protein
MPLPKRDMSDWDRVRRSIEMDEPIPYDANDPDDGPYDPNDDEAVDRFLTEANRVHPAPQVPTGKVAGKIPKAS